MSYVCINEPLKTLGPAPFPERYAHTY